VTDPRILLLDEATSALDAASEAAVQAALAAARGGGHTTIAIAHRLSTVVAADQLAVCAGGRVVEVGSHEALVAAGGVYAGLAGLQAVCGGGGGGGVVGGAAVASGEGGEAATTTTTAAP